MKMLTTKETAEKLGVTVRRVNDLITSGRLPAVRFGNAHMIREQDLKYVEDRKPGRPPKAKDEKAATVTKKGSKK
jgi:excisionase family DNA binding protein